MENNEELNETNKIVKPKTSNKKVLATMGFILLGVVLISALVYVAMTTDFTKTVNVWFDGDGEEQVSIVGINGDIGDTIISCEDGDCSSGDITLTNNGQDATCTVTTTGDLTVTYTNGIIDATGFPILNGETKTFKVNYGGSISGNYPMVTIVTCS